ncbi:nucleoporin complex subunit 54-domain-containing protein, partial [Sparassis latifolia]
QHYFYNLVDPSQVQLYGRPANATNDALWQKAIRENPDPSCLVPVIAIGFDDLQKRVEAQSQQATAQQERLKELQTRIAALSQRHQLSNASRLNRASMLQTQLTHRVLKLVQHLHLLIPTLRSSAIRPEEEALRTALEDINQDIRRPGGTGRMRGKLNELWALIGAVNAARERDRKGGVVEWTVVDDEGLSQIAQILADEQAGLAHLTKILQRDIKDLAVIQGTSVKEEEPNALLTSASTLRGSTGY